MQVTNLENGREVIVRVNDRGPFVGGRLIDVSRRTAEVLGFESQGRRVSTFVILALLRATSLLTRVNALHCALLRRRRRSNKLR